VTPSGSRFLAAAADLVDGRPSPPLGFALADAALLVTLFDVLGPALLLVGVFRLSPRGIPTSFALIDFVPIAKRNIKGSGSSPSPGER